MTSLLSRHRLKIAVLCLSSIFIFLSYASLSIAATAPAKATPSDARIESVLRAKIAKSKVSTDHFTFSVKNGVVTVEGTTGVVQHKGVMTRMAKSAGATIVHNNIQISDAARAKAAASLKQGSLPKATVTAASGAQKK